MAVVLRTIYTFVLFGVLVKMDEIDSIDVEAQFDSTDADNNGKWDENELRPVLNNCKVDMDDVLSTFDKDGDGGVSKDELQERLETDRLMQFNEVSELAEWFEYGLRLDDGVPRDEKVSERLKKSTPAQKFHQRQHMLWDVVMTPLDQTFLAKDLKMDKQDLETGAICDIQQCINL